MKNFKVTIYFHTYYEKKEDFELAIRDALEDQFYPKEIKLIEVEETENDHDKS